MSANKVYRGKRSRLLFAVVMSLIILMIMSLFPFDAIADSEESGKNRYNVMIVMDASGSMDYTDPSNLRHDAVNLFTYLLADEGNNVGSVVFSTDILQFQEPTNIANKDDKTKLTNSINSVNTDKDTNIGLALKTAVSALKEKGDPNIPSVIVMLSDGVSDLPTKEELEKSLDEKADAIQEAREAKIPIYTICLNANQMADTSEMSQIAKATNGKFQEVSKPEDLKGVFNTFYNLIYGTSTIRIAEEQFPETGIIEKNFIVPAFGVEEINIIINGSIENVTISKPDGSVCDAEELEAETFTVYKVKDIEPGQWNIKTVGRPGDRIDIDMVFNNDLSVSVKVENLEFNNGVARVNPSDPVVISADLSSGGRKASGENEYKTYNANLRIINSVNDEEVEIIPMTLTNGHFEVEKILQEGKYKFQAIVYGEYLEEVTSDPLGTVVVTTEELTNEEKNNTPPIPVETPVTVTVKRWPFKDNTFTLDMNTLANDEQDRAKGIPLEYAIISSSFMDDDYSVSNDGVLSLTHYSLSKGAFEIRATDSGGLSCDIEVIVKSINIGLLTVILLAIGILIALIVIGILTYIALGKPFMGRIRVENVQLREQKTAQKSRGRLSLKSFQIGQTGIDGYFQASGKNYVTFKSKKPFYTRSSSKPLKSVIINSGMDVEVSSNNNFDQSLIFRFESMLPSIPGGMGGGIPTKRKKKRFF